MLGFGLSSLHVYINSRIYGLRSKNFYFYIYHIFFIVNFGFLLFNDNLNIIFDYYIKILSALFIFLFFVLCLFD